MALLNSCALSVNDGGAMLLVVFGGDPGRLERGERGEGGSTPPDSKLTVGGSVNPNLGAGGGQSDDLILQAVGETLVHGSATGEDHVLREVLSNVNV